MLGYLPAKFKIRFLEPIDTTRMGSDPADDKALVQSVAQEVRARIQEGLHEMVSRSASRCGWDERRGRGVAERMDRRRVLITGLSSYWGGRLAQALESFAEIEAIVGVDTQDPTRELERTEFVKVSNQHGLIQRIVRAARIDTVIDTRLVVDSITTSRQRAHENNVIGTMNVLAACAGESSPVRKFIFKSSAHVYGCAQDDPAFFTEAMTRSQPAASPIERDVVEAEASVIDFANKQRNVDVTVLRCANVLGPDVNTSFARMFGLPLVPMVLGFDPRLQFVHEDDIVHALEHAAIHRLPGVFNVAADGVLALSEVIGLLGKRPAPVLPPWGTGLLGRSAARARRADPRPRCSTSSASAAVSTTAATRRAASSTATRPGRRSSRSPSICACSRSSAASSRPTPTRARSSASCAAAR